ncbi:hypothetical protein BGZ82_010638, partial [Podila clonocystis]
SGSILKRVLGAFDYWSFRDGLVESERASADEVGWQISPIVTSTETIIANGTPGFWQQTINDTEARLVLWDQQREPRNLIHEIIRLEHKYCKNLDLFQYHLRTVEEVFGQPSSFPATHVWLAYLPSQSW